jgi:fructoselysine-6-P-deglycase FrlB-like protein
VLVVSNKPLALPGLQRSFGTGLPEIFCPVLFAHVGQLLAFWRAVERGLNPDAPPHLRRTVTLETKLGKI